MVLRFPRTGTVMLKSDLRGIETCSFPPTDEQQMMLKSDLRGIETMEAQAKKRLCTHRLKSDLRGIETHEWGSSHTRRR